MVESLVTFLVQPEEDLLHMNQLPKKSSQKAYSAHTLGAPISSGELLYRDLQLTYIEFIEEAKEKSPKSEYKITKRVRNSLLYDLIKFFYSLILCYTAFLMMFFFDNIIGKICKII